MTALRAEIDMVGYLHVNAGFIRLSLHNLSTHLRFLGASDMASVVIIGFFCMCGGSTLSSSDGNTQSCSRVITQLLSSSLHKHLLCDASFLNGSLRPYNILYGLMNSLSHRMTRHAECLNPQSLRDRITWKIEKDTI